MSQPEFTLREVRNIPFSVRSDRKWDLVVELKSITIPGVDFWGIFGIVCRYASGSGVLLCSAEDAG
jgi:hypothetical protein